MTMPDIQTATGDTGTGWPPLNARTLGMMMIAGVWPPWPSTCGAN